MLTTIIIIVYIIHSNADGCKSKTNGKVWVIHRPTQTGMVYTHTYNVLTTAPYHNAYCVMYISMCTGVLYGCVYLVTMPDMILCMTRGVSAVGAKDNNT